MSDHHFMDAATMNKRVGTDIIISVVAIVIETVFLVVYAFLAFKLIRLLFGRGKPGKSGTWISTTVIVMFFCACTLWILDIRNLIGEVELTLLPPDDVIISNEFKYAAAQNHAFKLLGAINVIYAFMAILGDTIIISRVYVFWSDARERYVLLLPIACLMCSIAAACMLAYCSARCGNAIILGSFTDPPFCRTIQTTSYASAAATTAVATVLIGYKTWNYRRNVKRTLRGEGEAARSKIYHVMLVLIESGFFYMLFFAIALINSIPSLNGHIYSSVPLRFAATIYTYVSSIIVGMYPTILILMIHTEFTKPAPPSTASSSPNASQFPSRIGSYQSYDYHYRHSYPQPQSPTHLVSLSQSSRPSSPTVQQIEVSIEKTVESGVV